MTPVDGGHRPLRIAFVYDALYPHLKGGAERRYHEIGVRLAERHDVHMVCWTFPEPDGGFEDEGDAARSSALTLHGTGPAPSFYGADGRRRIGEAVAFARRLVPVLLRERFDVIDCSATPYIPVFACQLAAKLTGTPMVVTWHEFWGGYWREYLDDRPLAAVMGQGLEAACRPLGDVAVAVSPFTAERLEAAGRGPDVRVVANGVSIAEIDAAAPVGASDVLFVGRLIAEKKVDELLGAVAILRAEHPAICCDVVGDGPDRARLESLAESLGITGNVTFHGRVDGAEVFGRMRSASVLVLPSVREGYGITVVEGMAAGVVPVVARGPLTAASALVRDGVDGLVCDPVAASIAASIRELVADPGRRARMREEARRSAEERDWARGAASMELIFQELVAARSTKRAPRRIAKAADGRA